MLQASRRSYICWRCSVHTFATEAGGARSGIAHLATNPRLPRTTYSQPRFISRGLATVQHSDSGLSRAAARALAGEFDADDEQPSIRERLRAWEEENPSEAKSILMDQPGEMTASNTYTRPQNITMAAFSTTTPLYDGDELSDLRSEDAMLKPGDMVELGGDGSRRPVLAICLGRFGGYEHFYTSSGKWFFGLGVRTLFVVQSFAHPKELEPIIAVLPSVETPLEQLNALQDLGHGPTRETGATLLRRMQEFVLSSEEIYQAHATTLDTASSFIGDPIDHRYLTLHEIAETLLPASMKRKHGFRSTALYAVHRALLQDELFFRPLRMTGHKRSYLFEVSPLSESRVIQKVETMVREYTGAENPSKQKQNSSSFKALDSFIQTARNAIDQSRSRRTWTDSGILGPTNAASSIPNPSSVPQWSASDLELLHFMELWCAHRKFPSYSRLQCLGSAILRLMDRYQTVELLSQTTGWTFLQEVQWIPPWEIPARYSVRFPGVSAKPGQGYIRPLEGELDEHLKPDVFEGTRKEWDGITAYAIDSESTVDIDDAVSVEAASTPGQFWIHAHIADPASRISPHMGLHKYAERLPQTIYLPGSFERMFPVELGQKYFSLAPNRPCLTFSALVDSEGLILEHKITPGILKDVVYLTPESVVEIIGESTEDPKVGHGELLVGHVPNHMPPHRKMATAGDISDQQREELKTLSRLGKAVQSVRLSKGATPFFQPRAEARAYFDKVEQTFVNDSVLTSGDPSIKVAYSQRSGTDLVENAMKLAGEVAARWCHDRDIPIPYRTQPHAMKNVALIKQYTRDVFYPLLKAGVRPDDLQLRNLRALLGNDELTTSAGPHFTLGVDMYTKATSPLRRFSDLLVHWQIQSALLEEQRRGESLVGNKSQEFLLFKRAELDRMLPLLRVREQQARALGNGDGADQWILQALVRAWKFNEAPLPATFRFTVSHITARSLTGKLDWFERSASLHIESLNDVVRMADARIGDVLEVKLQDVNVHSTQIMVEAVGLIEKGAGQPVAHTASPVTPTSDNGVVQDGHVNA